VGVTVCGIDRGLVKFFPHTLPALEKSEMTPLFRDFWQREYFHFTNKEGRTKPKDAFEVWRNRIRTQDQPGDESSLYYPRGSDIIAMGSNHILMG
jgi:hypothetical protein